MLLDHPSKLSLGDFVLHADHGVARYEGVKRMATDGQERDFLILKYAERAKLYVPMEHIDLLREYRGDSPRLSDRKLAKMSLASPWISLARDI